MIRLSNYIANWAVSKGIKHVFLMVGGGAMHLNDALGKTPGLETVFWHHEQSCAIAAESYARLTGQLPLVNVTTGPGGLNALNGVFGAWTDSIPMFVISGQVRYDTTVRGSGISSLRQMGDQEYDIVRSVEPMTKYAVMVTDPKTIKYHLEKAFFLATNGRPGPVWLDIPLNVQGAMIDETSLESYHPEEDLSVEKLPTLDPTIFTQIIERLQNAQRPVLLVGTGVRTARVQNELLQLIDQLKIPVVTAWNAHDLIPNANPYYIGRPGTVGDRAGNLVVQNADFLLVLGCRLNIRQIGYNWQTFARAAYKIMVDIDSNELKKPTLNIDLSVQSNLSNFMPKFSEALKKQPIHEKSDWIDWCRERRKKYPVVLNEYWDRKELINPYCFIESLGDQLPENQVMVSGNGSACVMSFQVMQIKKGQRLYTNSGCASMGYDLPAAIGACVASDKKKIVCITGDGSFQLNLQELALLPYHGYPVKIFILNNNGYHSIRQTQINFFGEPLVGCDPETGIDFPDLEKLAAAYRIRYERCQTHQEMPGVIQKVMAGNDPVICEVMLTIDQAFAPKASSKRLPNGKIVSRPLEDLAPFLSEQELKENMIIDVMPE